MATSFTKYKDLVPDSSNRYDKYVKQQIRSPHENTSNYSKTVKNFDDK